MANQRTIKKQLKKLSLLTSERYQIEGYWRFSGDKSSYYTTKAEALEEQDTFSGDLLFHAVVNTVIDEDLAEPTYIEDGETKAFAYDSIEDLLDEAIEDNQATCSEIDEVFADNNKVSTKVLYSGEVYGEKCTCEAKSVTLKNTTCLSLKYYEGFRELNNSEDDYPKIEVMFNIVKNYCREQTKRGKETILYIY